MMASEMRSMMRPYEGPHHAVVAFHLNNGEVTFANSGVPVCDDPCEDWMFEIASITKVFAAILLCVFIEEGRIDPKAPLRHMSAQLKDVPDWITPERLTSHTSGLPSYFVPLWKAVFRQQPDGPYAGFSRSDLMAWLHDRRAKAAPRRLRHSYSNLGVGLLGEAMSMMEGRPFVDLLAEKVTGPMGLPDTVARLDGGQQRRFAQPKTPNGKSVRPWTFQSLAAAGCLRSSARDLAAFARAVLRALNSPETVLDRAICRSTVPIFGLGAKGAMTPMAQCSGWLSVTLDRQAPGYLFHNGATAGSSCALYICPQRNAAIGILSNNGVVGHLWAGAKLNRSKPLQKAHELFAATG